ncbi:hypothetical protein [Limosilactobacillus sp.]|uniref:hypothetical protein n=1 Tax=Limosilactobacillus sp. TaxID=2773925 RepID=UPI00345ECE1A
MTSKKERHSNEFSTAKEHHYLNSKHHEVRGYSSAEVAAMRRQAESIINLTKAMGIHACADKGASKSRNEAGQVKNVRQK